MSDSPCINYRGIKLGAWTVNFFTLAKVIPLLLFIAIGAFFVQPAHYQPFWNPPTGSFSFAVFLALWALQGFEVVALPSGESRQPERAVPIAAVGSLLCAEPDLCSDPGGRGGGVPGPGERGHQAPGRGGRPVYGALRRRADGRRRSEFNGRLTTPGTPWARRGSSPRWRKTVICRARFRRPIHAYHTPSLAILLTGSPHRLCRCVSQVPKPD